MLLGGVVAICSVNRTYLLNTLMVSGQNWNGLGVNSSS